MAKMDKRPGESIDSVLKKFKRKLKDEGVMNELRKREYFEKPSEEKKRRQKAARRRTAIQQRADRL